MKRMQLIFLSCFGALLGLSQLHCLPEPDPREKILELRVLGIKAEPPAAKPGDKVKISALVAVPNDDTITLSWYLCKDPKDAEHGCHEKPTAVKLGEGDAKTLTIPTDALKAELTPAEKQSGRRLPVTLVARAGKEVVVATKRIVVSANPSNRNPKLSDLTMFSKDGKQPLKAPWKINASAKYKLNASIDETSRESYPRVDLEGKVQTAKERLYLSWYLTDGTYSKGYLSKADDLSNTLETSEKLPPSGKVTLFLILRDGRGGVDWKTYSAEVE